MQNYSRGGGRMRARDTQGVWDGNVHTYTLLYLKWITNKDPLCSTGVLCGSLDGRGVCRRMDTCICMAESLHCSLETIIILLIDYTPTQNGKFKKKLMYSFFKLPIVRHICTFPYYSVHSKAFKTCMHNLYFLQC